MLRVVSGPALGTAPLACAALSPQSRGHPPDPPCRWRAVGAAVPRLGAKSRTIGENARDVQGALTAETNRVLCLAARGPRAQKPPEPAKAAGEWRAASPRAAACCDKDRKNRKNASRVLGRQSGIPVASLSHGRFCGAVAQHVRRSWVHGVFAVFAGFVRSRCLPSTFHPPCHGGFCGCWRFL